MVGFVELLGDKLVGKDGEVSTESALKEKTAVALYFSAHWCPPCRGFTPQLAEWYRTDLQSKGLEVVFISGDKSQAAFGEYFGEMPWLALPYTDEARRGELNKKFKVSGIPSVVVLDSEAALITKDGRAAISADPKGEDLPWRPKTFSEIFADAKLLGPSGAPQRGSDLVGRVVGLYFSAHWCPPCRGFTPQLANWYTSSLKAKGLEVVFVSSDRDGEAFNEYFCEQPWLALDYSDRRRKDQLSSLCRVGGIPSFVIFDKDGTLITRDGRAAVSGDPAGDEFPWYPKPVGNLKAGPGEINEVTTVLCFCETSDGAAQKAILDAMTPIAEKYIAEAKAQGEESPRVAFSIVTESEGIAPRLRGMMSMPALAPAEHEHPLEKSDRTSGWGCDGCGQSGEGKDRYRCTQGCDYDLCGDCLEKQKAGKVVVEPKLMIVDIPDNGAFYEGVEGTVTTATVQTFVDEYLAKTLERKQLS